MIGAIEAGGTKFVLGLFDQNGDVTERTRIPTTTPTDTLTAAAEWFRQRGPIEAMGIASFGPCDIAEGKILNTPKQGWSNINLRRTFEEALKCPISFDTDVNGAALAELHHGAGRNRHSVAYVTVGTGIGVGLAFGDRTWSLGGRHPELGHIQVRRHPEDIVFPGVCPFHSDCLEGLASGPAILARWGEDLSSLSNSSKAQDIIAFYLGQLMVTIQASLMPDIIILGGGVMQTTGLLEATQAHTDGLTNCYWEGSAKSLIQPPGLETNSGLLGAYCLATAGSPDPR